MTMMLVQARRLGLCWLMVKAGHCSASVVAARRAPGRPRARRSCSPCSERRRRGRQGDHLQVSGRQRVARGGGDLAALLANPRLASWARIALEAIPGDEASAALREAAGRLDGRLLVGRAHVARCPSATPPRCRCWPAGSSPKTPRWRPRRPGRSARSPPPEAAAAPGRRHGEGLLAGAARCPGPGGGALRRQARGGRPERRGGRPVRRRPSGRGLRATAGRGGSRARSSPRGGGSRCWSRRSGLRPSGWRTWRSSRPATSAGATRPTVRLPRSMRPW